MHATQIDRAARNALLQGPRAKRFLPVEALGETREAADAYFAAVCDELGALGPTSRHHAEAAAAAQLRAVRAQRMEDDLLALLAGEDGGAAATLLVDRDARATLALLDRYRRSAEADARREVSALLRLERARAAGLVPGRAEAGQAEAELDAGLAEASMPNEPNMKNSALNQKFSSSPHANDDAPDPSESDRKPPPDRTESAPPKKSGRRDEPAAAKGSDLGGIEDPRVAALPRPRCELAHTPTSDVATAAHVRQYAPARP
jgi:hypothetical protein